MEFSIFNGNPGATVSIDGARQEDGIFYADICLQAHEEAVLSPFGVTFRLPSVDMHSTWAPNSTGIRHLGPNWKKQTTKSRLAAGMPLHAVLSAKGRSRVTVAVSDVRTPISIATGICEETAELECKISFFITPAPARRYAATIRVDTRDIPFCDSIRHAVAWWETQCGYKAAYVPEHARLPMNSLWYSFHQQLDPDAILRECALSKPLGMDTVIIDDGWQTEDNLRGYEACGDWELAKAKIPDMKQLVDGIHSLGMKVMLWYSVPFIGARAKRFPEFRDMLLNPGAEKVFCLDPRYKKVRDYLVSTYVTAVQRWGLDGLKLDFISRFKLTEQSMAPDPRRDIPVLEDAIDALLTEITERLRAIDPEILIEFRQSYVGPAIRKYGNMLRAADCPNDALQNRASVVDLRLTSGRTPVHSDMLMWHPEEPVQCAALQLTAVLFSVPQISVRPESLPAEHLQMLGFYLDFWRKNRDVLLDGSLTAENPQAFYSKVCARLGDRAITVLYSDPTVQKQAEQTVVINASHADRIYLDGFGGKGYRILSCTGELVEEGVLQELSALTVPTAGMVQIGQTADTKCL